jgi:hypothetical protein
MKWFKKRIFLILKHPTKKITLSRTRRLLPHLPTHESSPEVSPRPSAIFGSRRRPLLPALLRRWRRGPARAASQATAGSSRRRAQRLRPSAQGASSPSRRRARRSAVVARRQLRSPVLRFVFVFLSPTRMALDASAFCVDFRYFTLA